MSLRLRIVLAFMAVVSLLVVVSVVSVRIHARMRGQVAGLRPAPELDVAREQLQGQGIEVEGVWERRSGFTATRIVRLPEARRPKLRGPIQHADSAAKTVAMFGTLVHLRSDTQLLDTPPERAWVEMQRGTRAEISCRIDGAGRWIARKIKLRDVKTTDKIKGTVTGSRADGDGIDTLEVDGIAVVVPAPSEQRSASGHLERLQRASRMALEIQELRLAAQELVGRAGHGSAERGGTRGPAAPDLGELLDPDRETTASAEARLVAASEDFARLVHQCKTSVASDSTALAEGEAEEWVRRLTRELPRFEAHATEFLARVHSDVPAAHDYLDHEFDPFLQRQVLPFVYAIQADAEELLAYEVRRLSTQTAATVRLVVATSVVAVALALVLAFLVWRSISRPIRALQGAAQDIGRGRFDARVEVHGRDELGLLATAFNTMVEKLATTTVSVSQLEAVHDSMAAALVLLDPQGRVTRVNGAAARLLGSTQEELVGLPFETLCPPPTGSGGGHAGHAAGRDGAAAPEERVFLRRDGTRVPVSFAGAVLRNGDGEPRGAVCVALDLTERKRIEERLQRSLAEKELLLREIHHRVKNNLQIISSLLDLQSRGLHDARVLQQFEESQSRIRSMALIHEQLYGTDRFDRIDVRAYLHRLAESLVHSFGRAGSVRLRTQLEELDLDIDRALTCGLIVNELVCNALKHAFRPDTGGEIRLELLASGTECRLTVADDGRGMPEGFRPEKATSLGLSLVSTLVRQLQGRLEIVDGRGTEVRVAFPLGAPAERVPVP